MSRHRVVVVAGLVSLVVAALGGATYVSVTAYDMLSVAQARCAAEPDNIQEPTSFNAWIDVGGARRDVDTTPYRMPEPEDVRFTARDDPGITIAAWWEPVRQTDGLVELDVPTVVVTHGFGGCRRNSGNLLVAGMLHRHGIAVLLIDMRDHGDSTVEDGRFAGGTEEYRDVLGAFDWLRAQGVPSRRIGLFGFSGGAIASMIAMGEEPAIAAIWADSSWTTVRDVVRDGLVGHDPPLPTILDVGVLLVGRLHGDDLASKSPLAAVARFGQRPVYLTQGDDDKHLNPRYLGELYRAVAAGGGDVDRWRVPGSGHTQAHFLYPAEYETQLVVFFSRALGGS